jgi:PAS domain S-box-containing protein
MNAFESPENARVIIADDERIVAADLRKRVMALGYTVLAVVGSGEDAVREALQHRPDLVLLDIGMEGAYDGIAAAAIIRKEIDIPVIFVTSYSDKETLRRAKEIGPFGYILKPFDERELATTVEMALFRHHMDQKLRRSEALYRTLIENTGEGIAFVDLDEKFTFANPTAETIFGVGPGALQNRCISDFTTPEVFAGIRAQTQERKTGARSSYNIDIIRADGERRTLLITATPQFDDRGNLTGAFGIFRDITEKHKAEEALRQYTEELRVARDAAEEASRAKANFLAHMSHEIRTPMNGVIGMTSLLLETRLTEEQQEYAETIRTSGESLLALLNEILDFSKIESGKIEFEHQPFSPLACIEEALELFSRRAGEKSVELMCHVDPGVPESVVGDVTRVRQILANLIGNAVKFTERGEVLVTAVANSVDAGFVELLIAVKDTGIGIDPQALERLFTPFTQADLSITRRFGGTGLGLAICKRLVELMDGHIWVESSPGKGSAFYFTLRVPVGDLTGISGVDAGGQLSGKRVLILDDNETNSMLLARLCQGEGMTVQRYRDPYDALACVASGSAFDVALVDLLMPGMDGVEFARRVRGLEAGATLPMILLSPGSRASEQTDEFSTLFCGYTLKPVKRSHLTKLMVSALGGWPVSVRTPGLATLDPHLSAKLPLRILLAEDNPINQALALAIFKKMGYRADVVADGQEVLDALARQPYDLIFMDVQMPVMDGLEATRRIIASAGEGQRPRIIAVTANVMQGDREHCLDAGMDDYISKPVKLEEVQGMVEKYGAAVSARSGG